jgi:hemerythrin-like domain-containing protein
VVCPATADSRVEDLVHHFIQQLLEFHKEKSSTMTEIQHLLPLVRKSDEPARIELISQFEGFRGAAERAHHQNEELILSELERHKQPVHPRIARTADEHKVFAQIVARLFEEINEPTGEATILVSKVEWFIGQYDEHATNEEAILFPAANQYLSRSAWSRVGDAWIAIQ